MAVPPLVTGRVTSCDPTGQQFNSPGSQVFRRPWYRPLIKKKA